MRFNRTPAELKRSVKDFYEHHYKMQVFDEDQILSELNPLLQEEVVTCGLINYIKEGLQLIWLFYELLLGSPFLRIVTFFELVEMIFSGSFAICSRLKCTNRIQT